MFAINNNMLLCIVDDYSTFLIMKEADGLSAEDLNRAAKIVFSDFGLPKKIISEWAQIVCWTNLNNFTEN